MAERTLDAKAIENLKGLDKQIDVLLSCKPLPESEIKELCAKVSNPHIAFYQLRRRQDKSNKLLSSRERSKRDEFWIGPLTILSLKPVS